VDTGSGGIELMGVAARSVELDTGSGSIALDLTTDIDLLRIDTGSGSVRLTVPENIGASINVDTSSGRVTTDLPIRVRRQERNRLQGSMGDGNGSIEIDTGSGSVRILRR
jgi:lia operon protein LiaG